MTVVIREGDEKPPVMITDRATSVCFYDDDGHLARAICIIPGSEIMMTTTSGDDDFGANINELKLPRTIA